MLDILPMKDVVTLAYNEGYDDWGNPTQSEPVSVKGMYRYNTKRDTVVDNKGDEVVYSANVYLPFKTKVDYETIVRFKDEYGQTIEKKPITIQHKRDIWGSPIILRVVV